MKRTNILKASSALLSVLALSACSSGGGGSGASTTSAPTATIHTGILLDSAVANISYQTATQSGTTNPSGEFTYQDGETITFSIGALDFPPVAAGAVITPITMAGATSITDQQATNIARLLQSLDDDGNPSNGITIHANAAAVAAAVNFNVDATTFENDAAVTNLVANSGSTNTTLFTAAVAQANVTTTLDALSNGIVGAWRITSGAAFNYLVLFADNTFVYAENDLAAQSPDENGLEVGTYTYDASSGKITFTIAYDDNAPGFDSGVGDIGTPATFDLVPTAGNTILTSPSTGLEFSKVDFSGGSPAIIGAWRITNGAAFNYIVLMPDNTFMYGENDLAAQTPEENGLEVGTYTYDAVSGNVTFTLTYDDNAPGANSGIGNIGTPVVADTVLTNSNNTMSVLGGALVFTRGL